MREYVIFTDATADMTEAFVQKEGIRVLPMQYEMDGEVYTYCRDWTDEQIHAFYDLLRNGKTATTSQIAPFIYNEAFEAVLKEGKDILYVCFSSGLSATIQSARLAIEELSKAYPEQKIICVDSLGATSGETLVVEAAAECRGRGLSVEECAEYLNARVKNMAHWFTVDDLMFLKRGGRISATTAILGSALQIKPVMHVDDEGHLVAVDKVRGRKLAMKAIANKLKETAIEPEKQTIYICHGDVKEEAEQIAQRIRETVAVKDIVILPLTPIIGVHSGPGTLAVFFWAEQR